MITRTYKCENEKCENFNEFTVESNMNDKILEGCPLCGSKAIRVYKSANVVLNFSGSYNSTRKQ